MEVYVLDEWLRRIEVIDLFESCVWTDRFALAGDIDLIVEGTQRYRSMLREGTLLACNVSDRIMQIVTLDRNKSEDGRSLIKIKGVSAEEFLLDNRVALKGTMALGDKPTWGFLGPPAWIMRTLFDLICVAKIIDPKDGIPFYVTGNTYPADTITEPPASAMYEVPPSTLYKAFVDICAAYDLGFRIVRNQDWSELRFNVYAGNNRTTQQSGVPAVVFSSNMDNLSDINEFESSANYKNCAMVMHKDAALVTVYAETVDPSEPGFEKRAVLVDANSIDQEIVGAELTKAMIDLGKQELGKYARLAAFDGEVNQFGQFRPNRDYILGDLVEMQSEYGANSLMRVSEIIYASDQTGDRSYPTLSINKYIMPGSWISWDYAQQWSEAIPTWNNA